MARSGGKDSLSSHYLPAQGHIKIHAQLLSEIQGNQMAKPLIDAKQALEDIRSGVDEQALMMKYNLSAKGLLSLFRKLVLAGAIPPTELERRMPKFQAALKTIELPDDSTRKIGYREIQAQNAVKHIKSGMTDAELMTKYKISAQGLQSLIEQLIGAGFLKSSDLDHRGLSEDDTVDVLHTRGFLNKETPPPKITSQVVHAAEPPPTGTKIPENGDKFRSKWVCPACGKALDMEYDECPVCGVIVAKFLALRGNGSQSANK